MATSKNDRQRLTRAFGKYIKSLRKARGLTQEKLAEKSGIAADTMRRLEHGVFSPSLDTLYRLTRGLRMDLGALFTAFSLGEVGDGRQLLALARSLSPRETLLAYRILSVIVVLLEDVLGAKDIEAGASNGGDYPGPNDG